jgi:hypothetical protein
MKFTNINHSTQQLCLFLIFIIVSTNCLKTEQSNTLTPINNSQEKENEIMQINSENSEEAPEEATEEANEEAIDENNIKDTDDEFSITEEPNENDLNISFSILISICAFILGFIAAVIVFLFTSILTR